jgi:hypothetical protein
VAFKSVVISAPKRSGTSDVFSAASSCKAVSFGTNDSAAASDSGSGSAPAGGSSTSTSSGSSSSAPVSAMEQLMREEERRKAQQLQTVDKQERKDYWLHVGIVVKVLNRKVGDGKYYKEKGTVERVIDRYVGEVRLADGVRLRLDQQDLETVIPKVSEQCHRKMCDVCRVHLLLLLLLLFYCYFCHYLYDYHHSRLDVMLIMYSPEDR